MIPCPQDVDFGEIEMSAAIKLGRTDLDAAALRLRATRTNDVDVSRRLLALALVAEGKPRREAAAAAGMDRQTLRDWVVRYNEQGIAGLSDRKPPGRPQAMNDDQQKKLADWVRKGPDVEKDGVVRWRRSDLAVKIAEVFGVTLAERTVGKILHRLGFSHVSARPQHPRQEAEALEAHKKTLPSWSPP
jgi:transposase